MGFFDRFRKRVQEVADETDLDELTAEEGTEEAEEVLTPPQPDSPEQTWDELEEIKTPAPLPPSETDDDDD